MSLASIATLVSLRLLLHRWEWVLLAAPSRVDLLLLMLWLLLKELLLHRTAIVCIGRCAWLHLLILRGLLLVHGQVL